jgi:hypothetical protein
MQHMQESPEMMSRDPEHTMRQSTAVPSAAIYARVSIEDRGKCFSIPHRLRMAKP